MRNWSIFKYFKEFLTCHVDCIEFLFWFHYCYCGYWKFFWILWCIISKQERERQEKRKVKERNGLRFTGEQRLSFFTGAHESPVPHRVERRCRERLIVLLSRRKDNFCSLSLSLVLSCDGARVIFSSFLTFVQNVLSPVVVLVGAQFQVSLLLLFFLLLFLWLLFLSLSPVSLLLLFWYLCPHLHDSFIFNLWSHN